MISRRYLYFPTAEKVDPPYENMKKALRLQTQKQQS
jgi:hypothetical protein